MVAGQSYPQGVGSLKEVNAEREGFGLGDITQEADEVDPVPVVGGPGKGQDNDAAGVFHQVLIVVRHGREGLPEGGGDGDHFCILVRQGQVEDEEVTLYPMSGLTLPFHILQSGHQNLTGDGGRKITSGQ